jgi:hypothetical protein
MKKDEERKAITPLQFELIYGIPRGSLGQMRHKRIGPRYFKAGKRRVLYMIRDVEKWLTRKVRNTSDE